MDPDGSDPAQETASTIETPRGSGDEALVLLRPDERRDLDFSLGDPDAIHRGRTSTARPIRDRAGGRDDGPALRVLDVVHRFLVVVAAEHEVYVHLGEGAKDRAR